jgi:deoxyribonuclease V
MIVRELHRWDVSPGEARRIQEELRGQGRRDEPLELAAVRTVAGADLGYVRRGARTVACAAVLVFSFPELDLLETRTVQVGVEFPYVPGLLSFREGPPLLAAFRELETEPDVILFDAHGYAHPRRFGAASHLGLVLDRPSIGCAKSRLVGRYEEPKPSFGDRSELVDRGEVVGSVVRSSPRRRPLFVSVGHRLNLESAVQIALGCCRGASQMPEPTRQADRLVGEMTRALKASSQ